MNYFSSSGISQSKNLNNLLRLIIFTNFLHFEFFIILKNITNLFTIMESVKNTVESNYIEEHEDPTTFEAVEKLLAFHKVEYKKTTHKPTRTSEESAEVRGATLASGAKAMLLKLEKDSVFVLLVLSAARKILWKNVRQILGTKKINLASLEEAKTLTKCLPGAIPPFGKIWGIKTYVDNSVFTQGSKINFNAGLRTTSISMDSEDYKKVENPIVCEFTG